MDAQLFWGAQAASLLATAAVPRPFYAYDLGHGRKKCFRKAAGNCGLAARAPQTKITCAVNITTRGILLRKRKLSDTSLIISWCTDSLGLIQTVARGARRPSSPFLGRLDLFFEAEVSIARSRKSNLHTLREVAVVNAFPGIRNDHRRTQAAAYFVELIEVCTETEHHEPEIFDLLQRAFGYLNEYDPDQRAVIHFESELARITGVQGAKPTAAAALGHLFGKLPSSRVTLLKLLTRDKGGS